MHQYSCKLLIVFGVKEKGEGRGGGLNKFLAPKRGANHNYTASKEEEKDKRDSDLLNGLVQCQG